VQMTTNFANVFGIRVDTDDNDKYQKLRWDSVITSIIFSPLLYSNNNIFVSFNLGNTASNKSHAKIIFSERPVSYDVFFFRYENFLYKFYYCHYINMFFLWKLHYSIRCN
jgi:hypothetical protein